jgi:hypothetical protein
VPAPQPPEPQPIARKTFMDRLRRSLVKQA